MNEDRIKELMQKSKVETSDDFTDQLMHRIEAEMQEEEVKVWQWQPVAGVLAVVMIIVGIAFYVFLGNTFSIAEIKIPIAKIPVFLIVSILFLGILQYIRSLHSAYAALTNK